MDDSELLRRLSVNDERSAEALAHFDAGHLDPQVLALVRLGALIAIGAPEASLRTQVDDAVSAGVTASEIIAALAGIATIVGQPRTVSAAPKLALALGHEIELFVDDDR